MAVKTGAEVSVARWGSTVCVAIPLKVALAMGIVPGDKVRWSVRTRDSLLLQKSEASRASDEEAEMKA